MARLRVSVVIPAYNEARSLEGIITSCKTFCDEVIVVDDGSTDHTSEIAKKSGAKVIQNIKNLGLPKATQKGLGVATGNVIITMDGDGQHDPSDIPKLIKPLTTGRAEVALGVRDEIPYRSERMINALTNLRVECSDTGTGFRAIKANIARKMKLHGTCLCGTFVLEAYRHGARIAEIPVQTRPRTYGKRKIRTRHVRQILYVLKDLVSAHGLPR